MARQQSVSSERRLNPFAFPTETDTHFQLLVLVVFGGAINLFALLAFLFGTHSLTSPYTVIICAFLVVPIFAWSWWRARGAGKREIRKRGWTPLASAGNAYEKESLNNMYAQIQMTVNSLPETGQDSTMLIWDGRDMSASGRAFGYGKEQYILICRGLYEAFVNQFDWFQSVLLHEIGHIANRDVSKTTFSITLGRTFFSVATIASLVIGAIYVLDFAILKLQSGATVVETVSSIDLFVEILVKFVLILVLIEMVRASVLRAREYDADARVGFWSANARLWIAHILRSEAAGSGGKRGSRNPWKRFRQRVAPLHPAAVSRVAALNDERYSFRLSRLTAVLAALFTGLSLATSYLLFFLFLPLLQLGGLIGAGPFIRFGLLLTFLALFAIVIIIFGLLPIVGAVGVQIQKASFSDRFHKNGERLLPFSGLLSLALLLSAGMLAGFVLTPITAGLSVGRLTGSLIGFLLLPVFFGGWAVVFLAWAIPLRWLSAIIYGTHTGNQRPDTKRRVLTIISGMALLPMFLAMIISQIVLSALFNNYFGYSEAVVAFAGFEVGGLIVSGLIILVIWTAALIMSAIIWFVGWLLAYASGWLLRSPNEDQSWAIMPAPLSFARPRLATIQAPLTAPPL